MTKYKKNSKRKEDISFFYSISLKGDTSTKNKPNTIIILKATDRSYDQI
jgi:hypothetical protein